MAEDIHAYICRLKAATKRVGRFGSFDVSSRTATRLRKLSGAARMPRPGYELKLTDGAYLSKYKGTWWVFIYGHSFKPCKTSGLRGKRGRRRKKR